MIVYQTSPVVIEGSQPKAMVSDMGSQQLLTDVLKELKKSNLYNAIAHDIVIKNTEVEV